MKTWEMLKRVAENPKLEFKRKMDGRIYILDEVGTMRSRDYGYYYSADIRDEWEEV